MAAQDFLSARAYKSGSWTDHGLHEDITLSYTTLGDRSYSVCVYYFLAQEKRFWFFDTLADAKKAVNAYVKAKPSYQIYWPN